ncbi:MAG: hypothetical protein ACRYF3_10830 [Janthinobacterium lividum]
MSASYDGLSSPDVHSWLQAVSTTPPGRTTCGGNRSEHGHHGVAPAAGQVDQWRAVDVIDAPTSFEGRER